MSIFKPWTWLQSPERAARIEELRKKLKEEEELNDATIADGLDDDDWDDDDFEEEKEQEIPYKSLRLMGDTVHVVLNDGTTLSKSGVDREFYDEVRLCDDEEEVVELFAPTYVDEPQLDNKSIVETLEEVELVSRNIHVLKAHPDFKVEGTSVYMKNVPLPMPAVVAGTFIEIIERKALDEGDAYILNERYEALKMFWYWTALNPIESSRRDLLSFVRNNDIRITKNGLLEMYRRVVSTGSRNKNYVNLVSNSVYKVKRWGQKLEDWYIVTQMDGNQVLGNGDSIHQHSVRSATRLDVAYNNLPQMNENSYTDAHTKTREIKVGEVYAIDENQIDLDNLQACSAGLHVGSRSFMFSGFGDTGVLALVNPSKVRAVPVYDGNKMRVSEMFIAAVVDLDEYSKSVDEKDLADYSSHYFSKSVKELEEAVRSRDFEMLGCQGMLAGMTMASIEDIKNALSSKVEEFA